MAPRRGLGVMLLAAALAAAAAPAARAQPAAAALPLQAFVGALTAPQTKSFRDALAQQPNANLSSGLATRSSVPININLLCDAVKAVNYANNAAACGFVSTIESQLKNLPAPTCKTKSKKGYGTQAPLPTQALDGTPLPQALADRRPLPAAFADVAAVAAVEGATYNFYWVALHNFYAYWICSPAMGGKLSYLFPSDWEAIGGDAQGSPGVYLLQESDGVARPFMLIMKKPSEQRLAILVRGTQTAPEWGIDFAYGRVAGAAFPNATGAFVGETHAGFAGAFAQLWPWVRSALDAHVLADGGGGKVTNVAITGHSLGSGVGMLVAYAAAQYLKVKGSSVVVDAMMFGSPAVGNTAFGSDLASLVNLRNIAFDDDVVTHIPCTSDKGAGAASMPACPNAPVPTPNGGLTYWEDYQYTPGRLAISGLYMPAQQLAWANMNWVTVKTASPKLLSGHICSYNCWTSKFVKLRESNYCQVTVKRAAGSTKCPYSGNLPVPLAGH